MLKLLKMFVGECSGIPALLPLCYHSPLFYCGLKRGIGTGGGIWLHARHHVAVKV